MCCALKLCKFSGVGSLTFKFIVYKPCTPFFYFSHLFLYLIHIHSGNVFEPRALDELIPDWREKGAPLDTPVTEDAFLILHTDKKSVQLPNALLPPQQVG